RDTSAVRAADQIQGGRTECLANSLEILDGDAGRVVARIGFLAHFGETARNVLADLLRIEHVHARSLRALRLGGLLATQRVRPASAALIEEQHIVVLEQARVEA